jgi:hypothetical protein
MYDEYDEALYQDDICLHVLSDIVFRTPSCFLIFFAIRAFAVSQQRTNKSRRSSRYVLRPNVFHFDFQNTKILNQEQLVLWFSLRERMLKGFEIAVFVQLFHTRVRSTAEDSQRNKCN